MKSNLLVTLLQELDSQQGRHADLHRYVTGTQPLAFIPSESRKALDNRLVRMSINVPGLVVQAISERLRVTGFSDSRAWNLYLDSQLDQTVPEALADALTYGTGYILTWTKNGKPFATVESPHECAVLRDPADRSVVAGVKRFGTKDTTEAYLYLPDRVEHWRSPRTGAATNGFVLVETIEHHLGIVPLVPIDNVRSEIDDIRDLTDALVKVTLDLVIASHKAGFGRAWVTGLELTERPVVDSDGNPVLDGDGFPLVEVVNPIDELSTMPMAIAENIDTKFGNFSEPTLSGFETAVKVLVSMIAAVSATPAHLISPLTAPQVPSADGLRAAEASLTARAESRQLRFGRGLETVGRLLVAISTGTDPEDIPLRVQWAPADTRSVAQETDAVVKLFQAGLLPATYALAKLGYSDDDIVRIRAAKRAETLDAQGIGLDLRDDE